MFEGEIADLLKKHVNLKQSEIEKSIETPPDSKMGDYAFPCFALSKELKKKPNDIAKDLENKIKPTNNIESIKATGPYVNFFMKKDAFVKALTIKQQIKKSNDKVVIEYSSPNIAKPFHIGHLRSTVIGQSLNNIYSQLGYKTIAINHLGDWGTQFGILIAAYKKWPVNLKKDPIKNLMEIYVRFNKECEKNESLRETGKEWFKKLEDKDKEAVELWKEFKEISLKEFEIIYSQLGVKFDHYIGESFYSEKMNKIYKDLEKKNLLVKSEGAIIVDLEKYDMPPLIMKKSDGATTYSTRDLASAIYRYEEFKFDKMLYEVGSEQSLHFKQFFKVLELMGYKWVKDCYHVSHGVYKFKDKKMSTREGSVVFVEDLIEEAKNKVLKLIDEKNPNLKNKETTATQVGTGAIIFNDLKNDRVKDVPFSWENALNMNGDSGPYLQYTHVRIASILRKSKEKPSNLSSLQENEEIALAKHILLFNDTLAQVVKHNKPHILARWLLDLAQLFNTYYQKHKVIQENKEIEQARLSLLQIVKENLSLGLKLLGLNSPEEM